MPNQRGENQTFVGVQLDIQLWDAMEAARRKKGESRSEFAREALFAEIRRRGVYADRAWIKAPDRAKKIPINSKKVSTSTAVLKTAVAGVNASPEQKPSPATGAPSVKVSPPKSGNGPRLKRLPEPPAPVQVAPADGKE